MNGKQRQSQKIYRTSRYTLIRPVLNYSTRHLNELASEQAEILLQNIIHVHVYVIHSDTCVFIVHSYM